MSRRRCTPWIGQFLRESGGAAAIEFAFIALTLAVAVMNATDIGLYLYQRMEVENATQMAVQAAWQACDLTQLPATVNCPTLNTALGKGVHGTSLGNAVSLASGYPTESYYCVDASGALQNVGDVSHKPASCQAVGAPNVLPSDYIVVRTSFTYAPMFPGLSVAGRFQTAMTKTAYMRLG
jgi:Flp pilus assembly pilin Flp